MGTNFYWKKLPKELEQYIKNVDMSNEDNILMHIGKRSGAGLYCMDCGCTFHKYGTDQIHGELNPYFDVNNLQKYVKEKNVYWYDKCPVCGKEGTYICTFRWTFMKQKEILNGLRWNKRKFCDEKLIIDEYGEEFTPQKFLDEIKTPVEYQTASEFC